mgnify:CR=1 FL=1
MPASRTSTLCRGASSFALLFLLASLPLSSTAAGQRVPGRALLDDPGVTGHHGAEGARRAAVRIPGRVPGAAHSAAVIEVHRGGGVEASSVVEVLLQPASGGATEGEDLDLPEFLPWPLRRDLDDLRRRVQRVRTVLFGREGIVDVGRVDGTDLGRLRLNLQYDPRPGVRFVLVLR